MSEVSKEACLVSIKFKSQLTPENGKEAPKVSKSAIQDSCQQDRRLDWPLMQMSYLVNDWKYLKKQVLQNPGYVGGVEGPCCMLHGILQRCANTMSKVSKEIK